MQIHTVYAGSPDDIAAVLNRALAPLIGQVEELNRRVKPLPSILSINRIADDCCCSRESVRRWIMTGRKLPGKDKVIKLKVISGLSDNTYMIRREDYEYFLDQFPSIRA
jgi:hypothetical protein